MPTQPQAAAPAPAKPTVPVPKNLSQAEATLGILAHKSHLLKTKRGEMESALEDVRKKYQPKLDELTQDIEANKIALEQWSEGVRGEWGEKKSLELVHGTIGFRTGQRQLVPLAKMNWLKVLQNLIAKKFRKYVRTKLDVDRAKILKDSQETDHEEGGISEPVLSKEVLSELGLKVVQEESFYVDLKN